MQNMNQSKRTKKQKRNQRTNTLPPKTQHTGVNHRTSVTSDETDVSLRFRSTGAISSAGPLYVKSFTPNAAYDVDPALGSTETYGFDEYAAFYSYYRVISYSYDIKVSCNGLTTDPVTIYVLNTNTKPLGSRFDLYSTNPYCQTKVLVQYGYNQQVFRASHTIAQIVGSKTVETEDNYRALTTGVPADLTWLTLAFESLSGANVACEWIVDIWMTVRFYGREIDLTLSSMIARLNTRLAKRAEFEAIKKTRAAMAVVNTPNKVDRGPQNGAIQIQNKPGASATL